VYVISPCLPRDSSIFQHLLHCLVCLYLVFTLQFVLHHVHVRSHTSFLSDHVRTIARLTFLHRSAFLSFVALTIILLCFAHGSRANVTQAGPRADCCTPGVCFYHLCCLTFCFAHSSRANEAGQTTCGLLHTCSLPIIIFPWWVIISYEVHVRTG
jgi:hypothetical protein